LLGSSARAGFFNFDPTGNGSSPMTTIAGIDIAPGNALAVGSIPLSVGATFQLDFQSTINGVINTNGLTVAPTGLATSYQITALASFTEVVKTLSPDGTVATFALAPNQASNSFFAMYYNPALVASNLAGTGFNKGTLILQASPSLTSPSIGIFSLSTGAGGAPVIQQFDQFGPTNHYPGLNTVSGSGSAMISADVTYFNPNFFGTPVGQISFNTSLVTAFNQVTPSSMFTSLPGGGDPNVTANLGAVNGATGPDFQFQADPNISFVVAAIPEPASIVMIGTGLVGVLGVLAWKKR
jgi:hypothetical protein